MLKSPVFRPSHQDRQLIDIYDIISGLRSVYAGSDNSKKGESQYGDIIEDLQQIRDKARFVLLQVDHLHRKIVKHLRVNKPMTQTDSAMEGKLGKEKSVTIVPDILHSDVVKPGGVKDFI